MLAVRPATRAALRPILRSNEVRIELDDTAAVGELLGFLRSFDCDVRVIGSHLVEVGFEQAGRPAAPALDRIRLDAFVRVWNSLHPSASARLLDDRPVPTR